MLFPKVDKTFMRNGAKYEKDLYFMLSAKFQKIIFIKSVENGNAVTEIDY